MQEYNQIFPHWLFLPWEIKQQEARNLLAAECQEKVSSGTQTDLKEIAGPHKGTVLS